jgi:hypothetical protein
MKHLIYLQLIILWGCFFSLKKIIFGLFVIKVLMLILF